MKNIFLMLLLSMLVISCQTQQQKPLVPSYLAEMQVPTFLDKYKQILGIAWDWNGNAQLKRAGIEVWNNDPQSRILYAFFESEELGTEFLFVEYFEDGTITSRVDNNPAPYREFLFIDVSDQLLDSVEAWDVFIFKPEINKLDKEHFSCAKMILVPSLDQDINSAWRLAVGGCPESESSYKSFTINAETGEDFKSE